MLTLELPPTDTKSAATVHLEHSLLSLSKWEEIFEKPFFGKDGKTNEEALAYTRLMCIDDFPPEDFWMRMTAEHWTTLNGYINAKRTATWFRTDHSPQKGVVPEIVTNELIYYWMISFKIPFEPCQNWHLSRLMTLIEVCGRKQTKPKKMTRQQQAEEYRRLNAERRARLNSSG